MSKISNRNNQWVKSNLEKVYFLLEKIVVIVLKIPETFTKLNNVHWIVFIGIPLILFLNTKSINFKDLVSPFAIAISGYYAKEAFLNNRLAEMHKRFQSKEIINARKVVDGWEDLQDIDKLNAIYSRSKLREPNNKESESDIENYYNVLMFVMFLNEISFVYRVGNVPNQQFLVGFAVNIRAYHKKLNVFIKHRKMRHVSNEEGRKDLNSLMYSDFEWLYKQLDIWWMKLHLGFITRNRGFSQDKSDLPM